ncbi:class I SAM-dependent methyltransferase [Actinoplanes oblitus]|uniref:Class I SAM-dependent methyltransferase n=1 Tax=Actinoplanes oblitus TaxID=3040509 RepID=A0ABY8WC17_9ACTN|nr:class I SAM-dependent methyltransferase [Actinoplanes oblitus]WIM94460.1 class I SAM-dependent methyltransferase [Actinoplanes oblitus]
MTELAPEAHENRQMAEWFGLDAARYDRARPTYPEALIDRIVTLSPGKRFVDVGCGTGISSRPFQAAGCQVLGVEPDARMAAFARTRGLDVEVARFEEWDPAGRSFDAVVSGTAWHWVDPFAGARKVAEVLAPHGLLALFDNGFEIPPAVLAAQAEAYRRAVPESSAAEPAEPERPAADAESHAEQIYAKQYVRSAEGIRRTGAFGEPAELRFTWERTYTRDEWLDVLPTQGGLHHLPEDARARFLEHVGAAIDDLGGAFTVTYTTAGITALKR